MPNRQLSRGLVCLLAVTCAVTAANLYYAQPLLHAIAASFGTGQADTGLIVTVAQLGYAAGLVLVLPVGDIVRRRPLLSAMLGIDAVALAASALAPDLRVLGALALLVGVSSVVVQMIVAYAATLAGDDERGQVIGAMLSGLLLGILLSRTFAAAVAAATSWRVVYAIAAGIMVAMAAILYRSLPRSPRDLRIGYGAQLRGVLDAALRMPALRWRSVIGGCSFAAFSCFWTTVTFLLTGPSYHFSQLEIGLFALVGAAGAATAAFGGRLLDANRHLRWLITGIELAALTASFGLIGLGGHGLGWLIGGVLVMDACAQAVNLTNQSVIYELLPEARSRLTTVYMTTFFVGGALGSALGS